MALSESLPLRQISVSASSAESCELWPHPIFYITRVLARAIGCTVVAHTHRFQGFHRCGCVAAHRLHIDVHRSGDVCVTQDLLVICWITLSDTPSRRRLVASPRRKACQPCHSKPAFVSAGRITSLASASRFIGLPVALAKMNPRLRLPHAALCCSNSVFSCATTGIAALLFGRLGSSTWLRKTDVITRISKPS